MELITILSHIYKTIYCVRLLRVLKPYLPLPDQHNYITYHHHDIKFESV